jgi:hypothetical protein
MALPVEALFGVLFVGGTERGHEGEEERHAVCPIFRRAKLLAS